MLRIDTPEAIHAAFKSYSEECEWPEGDLEKFSVSHSRFMNRWRHENLLRGFQEAFLRKERREEDIDSGRAAGVCFAATVTHAVPSGCRPTSSWRQAPSEWDRECYRRAYVRAFAETVFSILLWRAARVEVPLPRP